MAQRRKRKNRKRSRGTILLLLLLGIAVLAVYAGGMPDALPGDMPIDGGSQTAESTPSHAADRFPALSADGLPNKHPERLLNVPCLAQAPELPTGCEAVSAVMILQYYGEKITAADFVDGYLDCDTSFYTAADGAWCGPDPNRVFVGDPRTPNGYGCYAPVIEKALVTYFGGSERVENTTGKSLSELCERYLDRGIPVLLWASMEMQETYPSQSWRLESGELFTWIAREHCLVLVGYDAERYFFNDPLAGTVVGYEKTLVEQRYRELGMQSLVINGEA